MTDEGVALLAVDAPARTKPSNYPEPFASMMAGWMKHPLGDLFGVQNFGVNFTILPPDTVSALHHAHLRQDEFIYVLEGEPSLFIGAEETTLKLGMVAGFPADGKAYHLETPTVRDCVIVGIGDRS